MLWYYVDCMAKWCKVNPWISTLCSTLMMIFLAASFLLVLVRAFGSKSRMKLMKHSFHLPPALCPWASPPERLKKSHPTNSLNNHPWRHSRCNQHGWNARRVDFSCICLGCRNENVLDLCQSMSLGAKNGSQRAFCRAKHIFLTFNVWSKMRHMSNISLRWEYLLATLPRKLLWLCVLSQQEHAYPLKFVGWWCLWMVALIQIWLKLDLFVRIKN